MLFIYIYYFKEPFELHINVTVQFCVSTATPSTYLFAIALAYNGLHRRLKKVSIFLPPEQQSS